MERDPSGETLVSLTVRHGEEWQEAFSDPDLLQRFTDLVDLTQQTVDSNEYSWASDRNDVAFRWQHLVEMLGSCADSHSHPLFTHGRGWFDEERVNEVLKPISFRSFDASFVENALILTHSLAVEQQKTDLPGLSVSLNVLNSREESKDPEIVKHFTNTFDLRDMAEPTETVIGDMTLDDFKKLSPGEVQAVWDKLTDLLIADTFGNGYGWSGTPQQSHYKSERNTVRDYANLAEYGTTDRTEIEKIFNTRKANEIAKLRQERPDFGKLPDDFAELPEDVKRNIETLFWYFDNHRQRYDYISIDTYSFFHNLELTEKDMQALQTADILTLLDEDPTLSPAGPLYSYKLATRYYEHWVARHYPETQDTEQDSSS